MRPGSLLSERLKDMRQGRDPSLRVVKPIPFETVVTEFLEKYAKQRRDYDGFRRNTDVLLRHLKGKMLQAITPKAVEDFVHRRLAEGVRPGTVNRQRAVLSKIFNWAVDRGYYGGENPVRRVKRLPESPGRVRFLTAEEAKCLVKKAPRHLRPVIVTALHTGGRRREILRLHWDDIDLEREVLYFDQTNTKSGKQREVPIDDELAESLRARKKVRAIGGQAREYVFTRHGKRLGSVRTAFEGACRRANLGKDVTFHTLRHTFASWYMMNGGDLYRLQQYLGHSTITLTQRYAHLSSDYLKAGVRYFGAPADAGGHRVDTNKGLSGKLDSITI